MSKKNNSLSDLINEQKEKQKKGDALPQVKAPKTLRGALQKVRRGKNV